jgi:hypothetical protein
MAHVDTEHPIEMPTSVDEDVVQAFRADGPYEPLGEGVGPWRPDRGADDPYFVRPEYLVERTRELRVAVVQELIDAEEDPYLGTVLVGMLREVRQGSSR